MIANEWMLRARVFVQRFWQPTSACMTCMPGSLGNLWSGAHWGLALQTGLVTGLLALLLSFTPARKRFRNRYGNALVVGCLTALADAYSHVNNYEWAFAEPIVTGAVSGLLALAGWTLFEGRARRIRAAWSWLSGRAA